LTSLKSEKQFSDAQNAIDNMFRKHFFVIACLLITHGSIYAQSNSAGERLADFVDPFVGVAVGRGSCVPGPCLPHASIYPSPDTLNGGTGGYLPQQDIVGFSQLHTQGTGGTPSYGNFLISPQIGLKIEEADHASPKADEIAACHSFKARLTRYDILCEVVPAQHSALYKFSFPASNDAHILIDVARKLGSSTALTEGSVSIDSNTGTITGGGTFVGNWNPAPYKVYFCAKLSKQPAAFGILKGTDVLHAVAQASLETKKRFGVFTRFETAANEVIYLKIAVSFKSEAQAAAWLEKEVPGWDFDGLKSRAADIWEKALSAITLESDYREETRKFYSSLYHSMVQPRDRTGDNGNWDSTAPFWDDHYTLWDTWKTLFPLMAIIRPDMVRDNVNSFIDRHRHNGYVATAFIQGKEYKVGQGGDEADNIIADAYAKAIPGVNWSEAYDLLRYHAEQNRTPLYRSLGHVAMNEKAGYCNRMKSGSSTLAFAYNDFCAAQVAKGLGKTDDYRRYIERSHNWKNVWDPSAEDSGFTGFVRARHEDGRFTHTPPRKGYNSDFYEGTCWIYSYFVPHDAPGLVEKMGGQRKFIERLCFALQNNLIDFTNEPSFMTIWMFDIVKRPYLASHWANVLRKQFDLRGYPGDEDSGAMSSLYVFLAAGIFPYAGQDVYYLHGPSVPKMIFHLPNGKTFAIVGVNVSPNNIYIQSVKLNGIPLDIPLIHHKDIISGGLLEFTMGPEPAPWGCEGEFNPSLASHNK
jgi:predicted alpha-1,2-mannosidase